MSKLKIIWLIILKYKKIKKNYENCVCLGIVFEIERKNQVLLVCIFMVFGQIYLFFYFDYLYLVNIIDMVIDIKFFNKFFML